MTGRIFCVCALLSLGGSLAACSKVSGVFKKEEAPPLAGERISVLELQKSLAPDTEALAQGGVQLSAEWANEFWPQAAGFPNHAMQNPVLPARRLKNIWKADIGAGTSKNLPLTAQPVLAAGRIYTMDSEALLSAFDAGSGKRIWQASVADKDEDEDVIGGGIGFAGDVLFVTNGSSEVLAVSPQDGKIKWRKRLPGPSRAAPTSLGGRVFVSTLDNRLFALNAQDGSSLWEYVGIGETAGLLGAASPAADSDIVVPTFSSGEITALHVENGSVAWSDNLGNVRNFGGGLDSIPDIKAMPVMDNGLVIAMSFGGKLAAIDERTGARVWYKDIGGSATPWVAGNTVFVLSDESQLVALRVSDGAVLWVTGLPRFENAEKRESEIIWTSPVMGSGRLLLAGSHGGIIEVNAVNGKILAQWDAGKSFYISPIVANGTLYLLAEDGTLNAYR